MNDKYNYKEIVKKSFELNDDNDSDEQYLWDHFLSDLINDRNTDSKSESIFIYRAITFPIK